MFLAYFLSCSSLFLPINDVYSNDDTQINHNDELRQILPITDPSFHRYLRSYPRANRNTWFRVSTYQHFKPTIPDETPNGDNLLRWG